uniref:Uncharacterized protein n=1 Tax=Glossina austeni TaxID=7395 RepID=A0A1A9UGZ0_GLOAU
MYGSPPGKLRQQHSVPSSRNTKGSIVLKDNYSPRVTVAKRSSPSPIQPSVSFSNNRNQIKAKVMETRKSTPQATSPASNATACNRMTATQSRIKLKVDVKLPGGDKPSTPRKTALPTAIVSKSSTRKPVAPPPSPPLTVAIATPIKPKINSSTSALRNVTPTWNRSNVAPRPVETKTADKALDSRGDDVSTQTNEPEILNYSLLVGDVKFMKASKYVLIEIERQRNDYKTKQLLKAQRKFEQHSERQGEHISDLKEFLERSYVTRKQRKPRDTLAEDKRQVKLITSMDQILNREIPKAESVTNIKARIKRKEQELLSLFDNVQNVRTVGSKN